MLPFWSVHSRCDPEIERELFMSHWWLLEVEILGLSECVCQWDLLMANLQNMSRRQRVAPQSRKLTERTEGWSTNGGWMGWDLSWWLQMQIWGSRLIALTIAFDSEQLSRRKLKIFFTLSGIFWNRLYIRQFKNHNYIKCTVNRLAFHHVPSTQGPPCPAHR